jgi:hypothetical protein
VDTFEGSGKEQEALSDLRRELTEELDALSPDLPDYSKAIEYNQLHLGVLELMDRLSKELAGRAILTLTRVHSGGPQWMYELKPRNPNAVRIRVYPESDTVYLGIGVAGWQEWFVGKTKVGDFLGELEDHLSSLIGGKVEEIYWLSRGASEQHVKASKLYVAHRGKLRRVGQLNVWPPLFGAKKVHRRYEPY